MTFSFIHASSCCMNDCFCSDICLSLSAGLNALPAGSLPCSLQPEVKPPGALPCHRPGIPPPRPTRPLCQALIREGGGYNGRPRARLGLSLAPCSTAFLGLAVGGGG